MTPKVLTVYFSHSGNTRKLAEQIHKQAGGDIAEIVAANPYPADYDAVVAQAKREIDSGFRPAIKTNPGELGSYDLVFLGSPNWWNTVAPPIAAFLSEYDLSGKAIAPFMTHLGTGLGRGGVDLAKISPGSALLEGLPVWGSRVDKAGRNVAEWLERLGLQARRAG